MALVKCVECGAEVSTSAVACTKCGKPPRRRTGFWGKIAIAIVAVLLFVIVIANVAAHNRRASPDTTAVPGAPAGQSASAPVSANTPGNPSPRVQIVFK